MVSGSIVYFFAGYQLTGVCGSIRNCSSSEMLGLWLPLQSASFIIFCIGVLFLLLPSIYFELWLKRVAWWLLPAAFLIAYQTPASRSLWLDRVDAVEILGLVIGVITFVFITYSYWCFRRS